jgi:hypothetical protein
MKPSIIRHPSGKILNRTRLRIVYDRSVAGGCYVWQVWHKDKLTGSGQFEWGTFAYVFACPASRALRSAGEYLSLRGITN